MKTESDIFFDDLYSEHIERASFQYERRAGFPDDPELIWTDIYDFEEIFEAHIDALVIGEEPAIDICSVLANEGDTGELHSAIVVFCRHKRIDLVEEIIDVLDFSDSERVKAVTDALCSELSADLQAEFLMKLFDKGPAAIIIAASIIAYKRLNFENELLESIAGYSSDKHICLSIFYALGKTGSAKAEKPLLPFLENKDPDIVQAAISALIRIGCLESLHEIPADLWPVIDLGLSWGKDSLPEIEKSDSMEEQKVLSMGLIGNISIIPDLIKSLSNEALSENASLALNLITGAELYEDHFIPEEIDEDALFEDELEKHKKGELYAPGEEPGVTAIRTSQDTDAWQLWWDENASNFNPETRYRNGKPYSPECLIENLKSEKSPNIIRKLAYEELAIRYGIKAPFETDMSVSQQISAIKELEKQIKAAPEFIEGRWYYNKKLI